MELIEHINNTLRHTYRGEWYTLGLYVIVSAMVYARLNSSPKTESILRNKEEIGLIFTGYLFWLFLFEYQFLSSLNVGASWTPDHTLPLSAGVFNSVIAPSVAIMLLTFFEEYAWRGPLFEKIKLRWGFKGALALSLLQLLTLNLNRIQLLNPLVYSWLKLRTRSFVITWSLHCLERVLLYYAFTGSSSQQWVLNALNEHNVLLTFCTVSFSVAPLWMFFDLKQRLRAEERKPQFSSSTALETE